MRIAYVITRADAVGGASIHVRDLGRAMLERGHQAHVFLGGMGPVTDQLSAAGVPYTSLGHLQRSIQPLQDIQAYRELATSLRAFAPDLVSTHTAKAGWIGRAVCRSLAMPAVYTPHGWSIGERLSRAHGAVYTIAERIASPWSAAIVCVSEAERQLALDKGVGKPDQLHVIHNGVRDIPGELRAAPDRAPVRLISVARLEPPKDHATLLEALAAVRDLEWQLEIVGDGPNEEMARAQAAALGLAERVRFLGYLPDPATALARAQVFVLSSFSEGFPRSVLEAMRAGLPVVATDVGGIREAGPVKLVPPGSTSALSSALRELIPNRDLRVRLGHRAREEYERRFRLDIMVERTAELYRSITSA